MGWVMLAVIGAAAFAVLVALRVGRVMWSFAGAALMLGAAGYALQGRPMLPASPVTAHAAAQPDDEALNDLRTQVFGRFGSDGAYLVAADGLTRTGNLSAAVQVILGGLRGSPRSVMLWTALGTAYYNHDGRKLSPPAVFAFRQAARLASRDPGPPLFLGAAYAQAGDYRTAQPLIARAAMLTPADASYRRQVLLLSALVDRIATAQDAKTTR